MILNARIFALFVVFSLLVSGCDIATETYKPGAFGASPEDQEVLKYYTDKYGDLTQGGDPRFIEALMSTEIQDYIPKDNVAAFSKEAKYLNFWFVYDNFKEGDAIKITWKYLTTDYEIKSFDIEAGGDFGRGTSALEMPDTGWPIGKYEVVLSGRGMTKTVNFEVKEGYEKQELPFGEGASLAAKQGIGATKPAETQPQPTTDVAAPAEPAQAGIETATPAQTTSLCGNGACDSGETCESCKDCACKTGEVCYMNQCTKPRCSKDSDCDDKNSCTVDKCGDAGKISSWCTRDAITQCKTGDDCCPSGCKYSSDNDCPLSSSWKTGTQYRMKSAEIGVGHVFFDFETGAQTGDPDAGDFFFNQYYEIMGECAGNTAESFCTQIMREKTLTFDGMVDPPDKIEEQMVDGTFDITAKEGDRFWIETKDHKIAKIEVTAAEKVMYGDTWYYTLSFKWGLME